MWLKHLIYIDRVIIFEWGYILPKTLSEEKLNEEPGKKDENSFEEIDLNDDKIITRDELKQYIVKLEAQRDKSGPKDPKQTLKDRQDLVGEIFKSKGSTRQFL